jgi:hypothetical protein
MEVDEKISKINNAGRFYNASLVSRMPKEVAKEKVGYFGSISHMRPFGNAGLIIRPDEEAIAVAYNGDIRPPCDENLPQWSTKHTSKIMSPRKLLTKTRFGLFNSMVIEGSPDTLIEGVFCSYIDNDNPYVLSIKSAAEKVVKASLPVVSIEDERNSGEHNAYLQYLKAYPISMVELPPRIMFKNMPLGIQRKLGLL